MKLLSPKSIPTLWTKYKQNMLNGYEQEVFILKIFVFETHFRKKR